MNLGDELRKISYDGLEELHNYQVKSALECIQLEEANIINSLKNTASLNKTHDWFDLSRCKLNKLGIDAQHDINEILKKKYNMHVNVEYDPVFFSWGKDKDDE